MEMNRRRLLQHLAGGALTLTLPFGWLIRPRPCAGGRRPDLAARRPVYPGPLTGIDPAVVQSPGPWAG